MKIDIIFERQSPVDKPGFNDTWLICKGDHLAGAGPGATGPNHRQPYQDGGASWSLSYGLLAPGNYVYECIEHYKFKKCLLINGGGRCPSVVPNPKHNGEKWLAELLVHVAASKKWRGSAGCPTIPSPWWIPFISVFDIGQKGKLELVKFPY